MITPKQQRQNRLDVVQPIGREHFQTGVRMMYACRYGDALVHFQEAVMLEPNSKGYLSYLGVAMAHAQRKHGEWHRARRAAPSPHREREQRRECGYESQG